jgi:hypothetical protein
MKECLLQPDSRWRYLICMKSSAGEWVQNPSAFQWRMSVSLDCLLQPVKPSNSRSSSNCITSLSHPYLGNHRMTLSQVGCTPFNIYGTRRWIRGHLGLQTFGQLCWLWKHLRLSGTNLETCNVIFNNGVFQRGGHCEGLRVGSKGLSIHRIFWLWQEL